jgi:uncharacterized membrane protein
MNFGSKRILIFTLVYTIMLIVKTKALAHKDLSGIKSNTSFMEDLWEKALGEAAMYRPKRRLSPCRPGERRGKTGQCVMVGPPPCAGGRRAISVNCKILSNVIIAPITRCRPGQKMRLTRKCRRVWTGEFNIKSFLRADV